MKLAEVLAIEAGKPITDARGEVVGSIDTFRIAAEEATLLQHVPDDAEVSCREVFGPVALLEP